MLKLPPHGAHQRIGLFGGSFNPPHQGHRKVALEALKRLRLDWVWWLVSPQNPLKDTKETAAYKMRLSETRALARHPRFVVTDIEELMHSKYTAQTLHMLKRLSPQAKFVWIMGADSLRDLHHWHDWQKIVESIPLAVLARPGYSISALGSKVALRYRNRRVAMERPQTLAGNRAPRWAFLSMPLRKESSTAMRAVAKSFHAKPKFGK